MLSLTAQLSGGKCYRPGFRWKGIETTYLSGAPGCLGEDKPNPHVSWCLGWGLLSLGPWFRVPSWEQPLWSPAPTCCGCVARVRAQEGEALKPSSQSEPQQPLLLVG